MNTALHSHPCFKISHPEKLDVPPQTAWTQAQADGKRARLEAEHGTGFVIEPIPHAAPGDAPPAEEAPAAEAGAPRKIVGRDDPVRCAEQPFVPGDVIKCKYSGSLAEVLTVDQRGTDVRFAADGAMGRVPADNYGDYTLETEAVVPPKTDSIPKTQADEPAAGVNASPAAGTGGKPKAAPRRPAAKKPAAHK